MSKALNGWWPNWLKSVVVAAGALAAGDLGAGIGPQWDPRAEPVPWSQGRGTLSIIMSTAMEYRVARKSFSGQEK